MAIQKSRKYDYSDLDLDFIPHPTTGDVVKKVGVEAIKRSVRNLVLTNYYEKPFRPGIGSSVIKLLFENNDSIVHTFIENAIKEVIDNYEPRVRLEEIRALFNESSNGYDISLYFVILNTNEPVITSMFLERIR